MLSNYIHTYIHSFSHSYIHTYIHRDHTVYINYNTYICFISTAHGALWLQNANVPRLPL